MAAIRDSAQERSLSNAFGDGPFADRRFRARRQSYAADAPTFSENVHIAPVAFALQDAVHL